MPGDISCPWGGDLQFSSNGDFAFAEGEVYSQQRVIRRLLTNPVEVDSEGTVLLPADDKFNPDYGVGLGRAVDATDTADLRRFIDAKVREGLAQESTVDQAVEPQLKFAQSTSDGRLITVLEYQTLEGQLTQTGFKV